MGSITIAFGKVAGADSRDGSVAGRVVIPLDWISIAPRKWDCQDFRAARRLRESRSGPLSQGRVAGCTGYYRHHRPTFDARSHSAALRAEVVRVLLSISPYLYWSSVIGHPFVCMFPNMFPIIQSLNRANSLSLLTRSFTLNFPGEMFRDCK